MCYADPCKKCGQEFDLAKPHTTDGDCLEALARREFHAILQHTEEMKRIHAARAQLQQ